jgi:hypothetical protein
MQRRYWFMDGSHGEHIRPSEFPNTQHSQVPLLNHVATNTSACHRTYNGNARGILQKLKLKREAVGSKFLREIPGEHLELPGLHWVSLIQQVGPGKCEIRRWADADVTNLTYSTNVLQISLTGPDIPNSSKVYGQKQLLLF